MQSYYAELQGRDGTVPGQSYDMFSTEVKSFGSG